MPRIRLIILLCLFPSFAFSQDNITIEDAEAILNGGSFVVEKQCKDYSGCLNGDSTKYYFLEKHSCVNDTCTYFVMRYYGWRVHETGEYEFSITAHNSAFKINRKKVGTRNIFVIDFHDGDGPGNKAELKVTSKNRFIIYGRLFNGNVTDYIYYKRVTLPLELAEYIDSHRYQ